MRTAPSGTHPWQGASAQAVWTIAGSTGGWVGRSQPSPSLPGRPVTKPPVRVCPFSAAFVTACADVSGLPVKPGGRAPYPWAFGLLSGLGTASGSRWRGARQRQHTPSYYSPRPILTTWPGSPGARDVRQRVPHARSPWRAPYICRSQWQLVYAGPGTRSLSRVCWFPGLGCFRDSRPVTQPGA